MENLKHVIDNCIDCLPAILLGAFGGITRIITRKPKGEKFDWKIALPEVVIAIFSGLLVHYLTLEWGFSENLRTVTVALAGYSARSVTAVLNNIFIQFIRREPLE